jgi:DNA-binding transcriptional LysR family regulator
VDLNLDRLRTFIVVAREKNLSSAARELGASQPNVGRQMAALEKEVRLTLFVRHSRGLYLTKQGEEFLDLCNDIVGQLAQRTDVIREKNFEPEGSLRIGTGIGTSDTILENIFEFTRKFPKIYFSFLSTIDIYHFQIGDADVGIIPTAYSDPDIVQHLLYESALRIYAAPRYIEMYSRPKDLSELKSHKLISYVGNDEMADKEINIHLKDIDHHAHPLIKVNNGLALRRALLSGLGISVYEYDRRLIENNLLVDIFPDMPDKKISYYYTYHKRLEGSPKVHAFHDFLKEVVKVWQRV